MAYHGCQKVLPKLVASDKTEEESPQKLTTKGVIEALKRFLSAPVSWRQPYISVFGRIIESTSIALKNTGVHNFHSTFQYHHMISYLKFHGAPSWLIDQAMKYKKQLWQMKDGILASEELQKLPLPLQMELIFDVNVGHFHSSLLFRDTSKYIRNVIIIRSFWKLYITYTKFLISIFFSSFYLKTMSSIAFRLW